MSMSGMPSSAEQMRQVLFAKMSRNESDEAFDKALLLQLGTDSIVKITGAQDQQAVTTVNTLSHLKELGYDKDHEMVKDYIAGRKKMNQVLVKIGEGAARQI